jgi:hypothetical protein
MAAHKGSASSRPRFIRGGSPVVAMPIYHLGVSDVWLTIATCYVVRL